MAFLNTEEIFIQFQYAYWYIVFDLNAELADVNNTKHTKYKYDYKSYLLTWKKVWIDFKK